MTLASGVLGLFVEAGGVDVSTNLPLFAFSLPGSGLYSDIHLYAHSDEDANKPSSTLPLYTFGTTSGEIFSDLPLYVESWYASATADLHLYAACSGTEGDLYLYTRGLGVYENFLPTSSPALPIYLWDWPDAVLNLFVRAPEGQPTSELPLYALGGITEEADLHLFCSGQAQIGSTLKLFTRGF